MHAPFDKPRFAAHRRVGLAWLLLLVSAAGLPACDEAPEGTLRAAEAKSRYELVGGPVAYADVGDFVLENDQIRVAILRGGADGKSWGPGVFGGSLVDADLRRDRPDTPPGSGRDRLAEIFPFANLLVPAPQEGEVTVVADGSDGKRAVVRVEGKGMFLFDAIGILRRQKSTLSGIGYKNVKTDVHFRTEYSLAPGDRFVTMKTWVILPVSPDPDVVGPDISCKPDKPKSCEPGLVCEAEPGGKGGHCVCPKLDPCNTACPDGFAVDAHGCAICECTPTAPMKLASGAESVFGVILGDSTTAPAAQVKAGVGAGDFVFFGNQNDIFVPGHGFDEERPIWDALFGGRDTFAKPLDFDFVSAAGGDVSYAYYTRKRDGADPEPKVLVPIFTSAATAFISASLNCKWDSSDDATCEKARVYEFERYLAVGSGDIASVGDVVHAHRGTPTGRIQGYVRWQETGTPAHDASVFVFRDPDPAKTFASLDELVAANRQIDASPGVLSVIDADVGLDPKPDGAFAATLPAGKYVLVAMDQHKVVTGDLVRLEVEAGESYVVAPALPTPARLRVSTVDQGGSALPAKATLLKLGADGQPLHRDGGRRPYLGQGRLGIGVQYLGFAMDGRFDVPVEAGRYRLVVSHGTEYGISDQTFDLQPGEQRSVGALVAREVDTTGWISGDFHLHAEPSFDSGMPLSKRVQTVAAEGVDYVAATDHDVLSNYAPFIKQLGLDEWLRSVVGSEISTLEIGHYIGFPLQYKGLDQPSHGSVDWFCKPSNRILEDLLARSGFEASADKPTSIIAHPRDGFLGWADQAGVNPYSLTRTLPTLEEENTVLRTVTCDHDAMEVFNGKRFDLVHTPTVREVQLFSRCLRRIDRAGIGQDGKLDEAQALADLKTACPELAAAGKQDLTTCPAGDDLDTCRMRYRLALAQHVAADILRRTPAEQQAWLDEPTSTDAEKADDLLSDLADLCVFDADAVDEPFEKVVPPADQDRPCGRWHGVLSDQFRFLEHGLVKTMVGGSDSHGFKLEPGLPRTYIRSSTDAPAALDPAELARNLRSGQVTTTYGPFLAVSIDGKGPGETVAAAKGGQSALRIKVQTPSWFGIDRYEVYVNGVLVAAKDLPVQPKALVDVDEEIVLPALTRDSWVIVSAIGTAPENLMRPVYLDVPFGELQLARVSAIAFSNIPIIKTIFPPPARVPDFFPVYPMALSNAIFLDTDGNGRYDAPKPFPAFCSVRCDAATGALDDGTGRKCTDLQANYKCLSPEARCGIDIPGVCDIYTEQVKGGLTLGHGAP